MKGLPRTKRLAPNQVCCSRSLPITEVGCVLVRGQTAEIGVAVAPFGKEEKMRNPAAETIEEQLVDIPVIPRSLYGKLTVPRESSGLVLFAQGGGSGIHNSRNRYVASLLNESDLAILFC